MFKTKITKSALISSVVAMIICFAMLLGTTFAWFTDSASSGSNVIQAGNLDIVLEYWDGDSWEDAEGKVLEFKKGGNYNGVVGDVLWEPGCTYELPAIRVRNEGNLTAKVLLKINGITGDEKLLEAIKFETKVTNVPASLKTGSAGATFTAMEGESYEFIYGTPDGTVMMDWSLAPKGETTPNTGHTDTTAEFTISGHMAEEAGNEYQGLKIEGVSITALATQQVYEYDSFGREYDKDAKYPVVDTEGLAGAIAEGRDVKLDANVTLTQTIEIADDIEIDLNGFALDASALDSAFFVAKDTKATITVNGTDEEVKLGQNGLVEVEAGANAVIEINGGNFTSDDNASTLIKPDGEGEIKIVLNDVNYKSTAANGYVLDCSYYDGNNLSVEINGGEFEATTGLLLPAGSSVKNAKITANNTKNMQPALYAMGDMTIENCIIKAEKSHAVAVAGGATLTIKNCEVYAGSDAGALAFQVFSSGGTINVLNCTYTGGYGTTGKVNTGCVAIISIDNEVVYRKG